MKLESFFEKFNLFADVPNAIRSMRELILQLAVRGKLTNQSENESARSQQEVSEAFRIRRGSRGEPDSEDVPFHVPENWGWVAVGDAIEMVNGKAFKPEDWCSEGTPIIRIQNLNNENAGFNRCKTEVDPKVHVRNGDFLISWSGTPGTSFGAFIWNRGFAYLNQHIFRCELVKGVFLKEFLRLAINARLDEMISHAQGAVGLRHITKGKLESIRLPLPPLAEQKRIVAKVDDLMSLCNRLTLQQEERETQHAALARASLGRFAEAPTPANLQFLFHPAYAIPPADLRKSILTLAVQGKLVPQDPNDEQAEAILRRIRASLSPKTAENESIPHAEPGDIPFDLPAGWSVARLGSILMPTRGISYGVIKLGPEPEEGGVFILRCSNVRFRRIDFSGIRKITEQLSSEYGRTILEGREVLINVRGTLGGCAIVPPELKGYNIAREVAVIPVHSEIDSAFLLNVIASPYFQEQVDENLRGIAYEGLNLGLLRDFLVPIPPVAEQRRIVAKVDELMASVDQLEEQLSAAAKKGEGLVEAAVHEFLNPSAGLIQFPNAQPAPLPDRAAIGCYAIQQLADRRTFGRTAQMKVLYLAEAHIGLELGGRYFRESAGPLDQWIYTFEEQAAEEQWFSVVERSTNDGHKKIEYREGPNLSAKAGEAATRLPPELRKQYDRLLALLANKSTVEVEIIATLFATWNDSLIDGHAPSDAEITRDVRENWHPSKQRFKEPELEKWLDWMRQHSLVPKGRGPHTRSFQIALRLHS